MTPVTSVYLCMKNLIGVLLLSALIFSTSPAIAQFDSGSTGDNGFFPPINPPPEGTVEIFIDLRDGTVTFCPDATPTCPDDPLASLGTSILPNTPAEGFADGVLHFTTVTVPVGITLKFIRNVGNTPVTILAQGDATIEGTIDVSGENGGNADNNGGGQGGPGGFRGGTGGVARSQVTPAPHGLGPGGGSGGKREIVGNTFDRGTGGGGGGFGTNGNSGEGETPPSGGDSYGTAPLLPPYGGSGGGGGGNTFPTSLSGGGGGAGGGGALLIASSTAIHIAGTILAQGGNGGQGVASSPGCTGQGGSHCSSGGGGGGSGGSIRLITNSLSGDGSINALGGQGGEELSPDNFGGGAGGNGRIRLEAFTNNFTGLIQPGSGGVFGPGIVFLPSLPGVRLTSVGGNAVPDSPTGSYGGTDVIVDAPGVATVELAASRVPLGTTVAVTAKPATDGAVIEETSDGLAGTFEDSTASVDIDFPSGGLYFLEARATFTTP